MPLLKKILSVDDFIELKAYRNRNTLSPDGWYSMAEQTSWLYLALTGQLLDPEMIVPTSNYDHEVTQKQKEEQAERALDRRAES